MVFSSITFLCVFLPVVFILYLLIPNMRARNLLLIIFSLLFYAYGEPVYVFLMIGSTLANYVFARGMEGISGKKKILMAAAVVFNLGILVVFKYSGLLVSTFNQITGAGIPVPQITLPIGISFFTFQAMSYVLDVYWGKVKCWKNYGKVLLYISFFPQLIAGPIVKCADIAAEIDSRRQTPQEVALGLRRFTVGLGKKVLIANVLGAAADQIFQAGHSKINILGAWLGALAYLLQIYYDFSGYSDMAIGLGRMFGFHFKENFRYPYGALGIRDFWRRWHISLSSWFKEYLYIPLGGNRKGKGRTCANRMLVFLLTGLWHGANWTFVVWGLYHGAFLLLETYLPLKASGKRHQLLGHIYTLLVVCVGFVIFRSDTLAQSGFLIKEMFTGFHFDGSAVSFALQQCTPLVIAAGAVGIVGAMPFVPWLKEKFCLRLEKGWLCAAACGGSLLLLAVCIISLSGGGYNPFIYFQF